MTRYEIETNLVYKIIEEGKGRIKHCLGNVYKFEVTPTTIKKDIPTQIQVEYLKFDLEQQKYVSDSVNKTIQVEGSDLDVVDGIATFEYSSPNVGEDVLTIDGQGVTINVED